MESILQCKFIFTNNGGSCAIDDSLKENPDGTYTLDRVKENFQAETKEQTEKMKITKESAYIFRSNAKFFYAVKSADSDIHRLIVVKGKDVKNLQRKGSSSLENKLTYRDSSQLSNEGTYGSVIQYPSENLIYKSSRETTIKADFIKEIGVYNLFKQFTCLPEFHDFFISTKKNPVMVLNKGFSTLNEAKLDLNQRKIAIFQILKCMRLFNSQGLIHLDLKPQNILVNIANDQSINTQIIDWGFCVVDHCPWAYSNTNSFKQTRLWRSPEIHAGESYNYKADIFSIGIMLAEMIMLNNNSSYNKWWFPSHDGLEYNNMVKKNLLGIYSDLSRSRIRLSYPINFPFSLKPLICFNIARSNQDYFEFKLEDDYNPTELEEAVVAMFLEDDHSKIDHINSLIQKWRQPEEPEKENLLDLLASMLEFNPDFRIDYYDAVMHPYFQNIKRPSYGEFPIFLNKIDLNKYLDKIYSTDNLKKREDFIKLISKMEKTSNEAKFLTLQLLDVMISESKQQELKFVSIRDSALFIARCIYENGDDDPETDEFLEISRVYKEVYIQVYRNKILNDIKLLKYKLIVPSLYSYWVYYNQKLPDSWQVEAMLNVYNYPEFYTKSFEYWINILEKDIFPNRRHQ